MINSISFVEYHDNFTNESNNFNIIIVDDEDIKRKILIKTLKNIKVSKNIKIQTVTNCKEAVELVSKYIKHRVKIDLILIDEELYKSPVKCDGEKCLCLCCNEKNNGLNATKIIRNLGYNGNIFSISSHTDDIFYIFNFFSHKGTGLIGRNINKISITIKTIIIEQEIINLRTLKKPNSLHHQNFRHLLRQNNNQVVNILDNSYHSNSIKCSIYKQKCEINDNNTKIINKLHKLHKCIFNKILYIKSYLYRIYITKKL